MKKCFFSIIGALFLVVVASTALADTFVVTEAVTDYGSYVELDFTVSTDYTDIVEFAIGNNDAMSAWVNPDASNAPTFLTQGMVARKSELGWRVWTSSGYRYLTWLDNAMNFADYGAAFLFTSWNDTDEDYSGFLDVGFTNGYWGSTQLPIMSPFAAYSLSNTVMGPITGETSAVPIPGTIWLLALGLAGFVSARPGQRQESA